MGQGKYFSRPSGLSRPPIGRLGVCGGGEGKERGRLGTWAEEVPGVEGEGSELSDFGSEFWSQLVSGLGEFSIYSFSSFWHFC